MTTKEKSQFLLIFRHPRDQADPTPEEMQKILGKWMDWMRSMAARGQMLGANRLQETGKVLNPPRPDRATDGPYVEAKEVVGGYILITADDLAQAAEIARGCPGLENETIVEVRPVEPLPPI